MSLVHVPDELTPYLEESTERVLEANDLAEDLELTCSLPVERMNIDQSGVTVSGFTRFEETTTDNRNRHLRLINQHVVEAIPDVDLVWGRSEALDAGTHSVWVMTDGDVVEYPHPFAGSEGAYGAETIRLPSDVYVYERLPFSEPVESVDSLEAELESVLSEFAGAPVELSLTS